MKIEEKKGTSGESIREDDETKQGKKNWKEIRAKENNGILELRETEER